MKKTGRGLGSGICLVSCKILLACVLFSAVAQLYAVPPRLHVEGNKVKDPNGNTVILRGVAMIDLGFLQGGWEPGSGSAVNMVDRITDLNDTQGNSPGWYTKIIRIMIAPPDSVSGWPYPFNPDNNDLYNLLRTVVDYCAEKEVYAAIDWHYVANTYDHVATTSAFWTYMAPRFKDDTHVIFELFNEPINPGASDAARWTSVKKDMQTWIDIIRGYAPDNLIFVGTPSYCQIIGPTATNPVSDGNVVYISHIYPTHWLSNKLYYTSTITAAAAKHPVILGEWGFESSSDQSNYITNGTISNYGQPLKEFVEGIGIGSIAWVASYDWEPPMFNTNWTLRVGPGEMGGFAKDWLYQASGGAMISKCNVTAGKTQARDVNDYNDMKDTFAASGSILLPTDVNDINSVGVTITSPDGNVIYPTEDLNDFSATTVNKTHKYTHSAKLIKGQAGKITSLTLDFRKGTFAITGKNLNLTGLACPFELKFTMAGNELKGYADETIVNGPKKLIPTRLMRAYKDTLVVNKAKAKYNSRKGFSDTLSVTGDIAVIDTDVNLCNYDVNFVWGNQLFNVAPGKFKASKTGHLYKCAKDVNDANGSPGVVTAQVDIDKATFTLSVNKANAIDANDANTAPIRFGVSFADFNEAVDVNRVTGRSWSY